MVLLSEIEKANPHLTIPKIWYRCKKIGIKPKAYYTRTRGRDPYYVTKEEAEQIIAYIRKESKYKNYLSTKYCCTFFDIKPWQLTNYLRELGIKKTKVRNNGLSISPQEFQKLKDHIESEKIDEIEFNFPSNIEMSLPTRINNNFIPDYFKTGKKND